MDPSSLMSLPASPPTGRPPAVLSACRLSCGRQACLRDRRHVPPSTRRPTAEHVDSLDGGTSSTPPETLGRLRRRSRRRVALQVRIPRRGPNPPPEVGDLYLPRISRPCGGGRELRDSIARPDWRRLRRPGQSRSCSRPPALIPVRSIAWTKLLMGLAVGLVLGCARRVARERFADRIGSAGIGRSVPRRGPGRSIPTGVGGGRRGERSSRSPI